MIRLFALTLPLLSGCIVYDHEGKRHDEEDYGRDDVPLEEVEPGTPPDVDTGGTVVTLKFALDPSEAYPGDTFIAHLTASDGFDLSRVDGASFVDGPAILALEPAEGELLLTIQVGAAAAPGAVDLILHQVDGRTEYVPQALTILEPEQGGTTDTEPCD